MSTINVLSNVGPNRSTELGGSVSSKDVNSSDGTESAAAEFAAILGGWMFPLFGSKGQGSEEIKAGDGGQQASPDSMSLATISGISGLELQKVLAGILGLGQTQVLQSNFPAGMEANSGSTKDQGSDSIIAALTAILKDASPLTELDQYKETIAKLLQELSGKIETVSPQVNQIKALFSGNLQQIQQVLASFSGGIAQDVNPQTLTAIQAGLMANDTKGAKVTQDIKGTVTEVIKDVSLGQQNPVKPAGKAQSMVSDLKGQESGKGIVTGQTEESGIVPFGGMTAKENSSRNIQGNLINEGQEKIAPTPLWDQIASSLRPQLLNRRSDVNNFQIQLHPAELGKIQISLHWEDGQVHLQLSAAEVTTGKILQSHLSDLRQSLQDSGVNCGLLQMGLGGEQRQTPQQDQKGYTFNWERPIEEEQAGYGEIPYSSLLQQGEHRINVTA